ncbi:hypothetical protein [Hyphomicrobium facile]|uniref:Transmembrane protein n=1 Tax=Hyphomicrobium facile TaxID=51670 RepID=A0A1I7MTL5_9HYPH|nr:hypothetical protein [Hyphomicrobium facile]SFV25742.1 hypothetical protein SAMN04488557_0081 [Hyphomicrobium facile]
MMIRAATTDPFSLSDAAAIVAGLLVVGILVFCISICAEESPISEFLHRTQAEADASRFNELLGALDVRQRTSHPRSGVEDGAAHKGEAMNATASLERQSRTRNEIRVSDRD